MLSLDPHSGVVFFKMLRGKHSSMRLAILLATFAVVGSDPAIAAIVCSRSTACPEHGGMAAAKAVDIQHSIQADKACCPMHRQPSKPPLDSAECCAWSSSDSLIPTVSFASDQSQSGELHAALLPAGIAFSHARDWRAAGFEQAASYVKPVNQKKTDLRI
jgi:hypothetical protein